MDVFDLQAKITLDSSGYERDLDKAAGHISSFASEAEGFFKNIGAAISAAFAVDKVKDFVSGAVSAFSEFEQLVGGVDTLFKGSSGKLQENADTAFQRAGMSANDYMENATSFAATLIQALGGDTEKAVDYVDRAVVSMADNANKMGTDLQTVAGTYQSLARGNYGMLDNLKLGYGGVKTELERLIADAATYTDVQREMGITVDASSMSFDNIVNALAVVQGHLGIAGATAEEAATTIEGSVNSMKAAWENWLTGLGNENADMSVLTDNLTGSIRTVAENVTPVLDQIRESLVLVFSDLTGIDLTPALAAFDQLKTSLTEIGKGFVEGGISGGFDALVGQIDQLTGFDLSGIVDTFSGIGEAFSEIKTAFAEGGIGGGFEAIVGQIESLTGLDLSGVTETFSGIGESLAEVGTAFAEGGVEGGLTAVVEQISELTGIDLSGVTEGISGIAEVFSGLGDAFAEGGIGGAIDHLVSGFGELTGLDLSGLGDGIKNVIGTISEIVPEIGEKVQEIFGQLQDVFTVYVEYVSAVWPIIQPIISGLFSAFGTFVSTAFETIGSVIENILSAIQGGVDVITGVIGAVAAVLQGDFETAAAAIKSAWNGVLDFFGGIANGIMDAFKGLVSAMAGIGRDMWNGLKEGFSAAVDGIKGIGGKISDGFKSVFDINSPSRVFAEYGKFMAQGLEVGWNSEIGSIKRTMSDGLVMRSRVDFSNSAIGRASAASINSAMSAAQAGGGNVSINLNVDGRTLATVLFDPLNNVIKQKGVTLGA